MMSEALLSQDNIMRVLKLTGFEYTSNLWWRDDEEGRLQMFINCSDFFAWGGADLEEITDANIDLLASTVAECEDILGKYNADDAFLLWCARLRQRRPQGAYYKNLEEELWPLFDECGPEREVTFVNPHPQP